MRLLLHRFPAVKGPLLFALLCAAAVAGPRHQDYDLGLPHPNHPPFVRVTDISYHPSDRLATAIALLLPATFPANTGTTGTDTPPPPTLGNYPDRWRIHSWRQH